MASNTTNYGWTKPDYEDDADIMVINDTIDNIDAKMKEIDEGKTSIEDLIPQTMALNDNVDNYLITESLTERSGVRRWICPSSTVRNSLTGLPADFPAYPDFEVEFRQLKSNGTGVQSLYGGSLTTVYQAIRFYKNGSYSSWYKVAMEAVT